MRKKHALFSAFIGLCAFVGCAGWVRGDTITVHSLSESPGTGVYTYAITLDAAADVNVGDGFVIYDFPDAISYSITGGLLTSQFSEFSTLTSNVLSEPSTVDAAASALAAADSIPFDNPTIPNLSFVYDGPPNPFLGATTAVLTIDTADTGAPTPSMYGSIDHSGPLPSAPYSVSTNAVLVPSVPEPTSLAFLGIGSAGLLARRRKSIRRSGL
jgi:hypothetical protein